MARLGPDPLRADADPERAWRRISRSDRPIGDLLMDQEVVAGVGNVFRAEVLFRHRLHPLRPGRTLRRSQFQAVWDDLRVLLAEGVVSNRIDTVRPEHTPEAMGRDPRKDDHGGEVYVYRRHGSALPRLRHQGPDGDARRAQLVLVPAVPADVPLTRRTVTPPISRGSGHDRTTRHVGPACALS